MLVLLSYINLSDKTTSTIKKAYLSPETKCMSTYRERRRHPQHTALSDLSEHTGPLKQQGVML